MGNDIYPELNTEAIKVTLLMGDKAKSTEPDKYTLGIDNSLLGKGNLGIEIYK